MGRRPFRINIYSPEDDGDLEDFQHDSGQEDEDAEADVSKKL